MKKINDNFCGYLKIEDNICAYNVTNNIVTLLPAQSDREKRFESFRQIEAHKTDEPEYLFGEDSNSMIAMLRKGKFVSSFLGLDTSIKFMTPIIVKACGNAHGFFNMLTEPWEKFHAITFYGGNINALYDPSMAIKLKDVDNYLNCDGSRKIEIRPWSDYTRAIDFEIENEKVTLTFSIGQSVESTDKEHRGMYNLGELNAFICFSFQNAQEFETIEKYYLIARKIIAILTSQNNVCFEQIYLSQRNGEEKYFKTGVCKISDHYENYSVRQGHNVISIVSIFDYIPELIDGIVKGEFNSLLDLLPEDNKMVNLISIKNVQDLCTALEVSYHLDKERKREKDALIEKLKKNIKKTIMEFTKIHNEIDVSKETTVSSAFSYLDYTLKQKILTLCNENKDIVNSIESKHLLPPINEDSVDSFVKLRNNKTHSGTIEWGESAKIYATLFGVVYASFLKYIGIPEEVIQSVILQII